MAADLATAPSSGLRVQACGDAHLANFGGFAAPDRTLVFDMNDFDETHPARSNGTSSGWPRASRSRPGRARFSAKTARRSSDGGALVPGGDGAVRGDDEPRHLVLPARHAAVLDRWRSQVSPDDVKRFEHTAAKAGEGQPEGLSRLTQRSTASVRIVSDPPLVVPLTDLAGDPGAVPRPGCTSATAAYRHSLQHDRRHLLERLPARRLRAQGRGCRERRDAVLDRTLARQGRCRSALPAGEGSRSLRARAVRRQEPVRQPWSTGGGGATPAAGGGRHPARVDACAGGRRRRTRLLRASAVGLEGVGRPGDDDARDPEDLRGALWLDARAWSRTVRRPDRHRGYLGTGAGFDRAIADFAAAYADQNERDFEAVSAAERS